MQTQCSLHMSTEFLVWAGCIPASSVGIGGRAAVLLEYKHPSALTFVTAPGKQLLEKAELRCRAFSPDFWEGEKQTVEMWTPRRAAGYAEPAGAGCRLGKPVPS